ncbi:MAG: serine hydrolase [bacterium]|nr:serine hydrolase [bacterium]
MQIQDAKRNIRVLVVSLLASMFFWVSVNAFDTATDAIIAWKFLENNPHLLGARLHSLELEKARENLLPYRAPGAKDPQAQAQAVAIFFVNKQGEQKQLFGYQEKESLPIASITKLMTAVVATSFIPNDTLIPIRHPVIGSGFWGQYRVGSSFRALDLLHPLLIESSNDAATYFAQHIGEEEFVESMNETATSMGLKSMYFSNPTGLDTAQKDELNRGSAEDVASLVAYIIHHRPDILRVLSTQEFQLYTSDGQYHHTAQNTNRLLGYKEWPTRVIGGKTGTTSMAGECLVLILEAPKNKGYIVLVLLNSPNRFQEATDLVEWTYISHKW